MGSIRALLEDGIMATTETVRYFEHWNTGKLTDWKAIESLSDKRLPSFFRGLPVTLLLPPRHPNQAPPTGTDWCPRPRP